MFLLVEVLHNALVIPFIETIRHPPNFFGDQTWHASSMFFRTSSCHQEKWFCDIAPGLIMLARIADVAQRGTPRQLRQST